MDTVDVADEVVVDKVKVGIARKFPYTHFSNDSKCALAERKIEKKYNDLALLTITSCVS